VKSAKNNKLKNLIRQKTKKEWQELKRRLKKSGEKNSKESGEFIKESAKVTEEGS